MRIEENNTFKSGVVHMVFPLSSSQLLHESVLIWYILVYIGTGKTLMARQIGKMLNTREPKIISGPGKIYFSKFIVYTVFK